MNTTMIDLDQLDLGDDNNPFDAIASKLESLSLEGFDDNEKHSLEKTVMYLERKCQDFQEEHDSQKSRLITQAMQANLLILNSGNYSALTQVTRNLNMLKRLSSRIQHYSASELDDLDIKSNLEKIHGGNWTMDEMIGAINKLYHSELAHGAYPTEEWLFEMNFETLPGESHMPLSFLHTFIEGLRKIDGVKVTLEDIKIGSIKAKVRISFEGEDAKAEVKELLESTRKTVAGSLATERIVEQAQPNLTELQEEAHAFQPSAAHGSSLDEQLKKEELRRQRLENERLELELFRDKNQILKEMLTEGIISQRHFELLIKGIPFLKLEDGLLTIGESIDVIDGL